MVAFTNCVLNNTAFSKLMQVLLPVDSCLENVFLEAEWGKHRISVYAVPTDDYTLTVEDFGYESKGTWHQATPTENQLEQLQKRLDKELARLYEESDEYWDDQDAEDSFNYDVQQTYNHINNNFYNGY